MLQLTTSLRTAVLALPWVHEVRQPGRCGSMRGGAPLKVHWKRDGTRQNDPEIINKWRCTKSGRYRFTALKNSYADNGDHCWHHLIYRCVFGNPAEERRTERWWTRHGYLKESESSRP